MKTTAKILFLPVVTVMAVFLSSCGGEEENSNDGNGNARSATSEGAGAADTGYPLSTCVVSGEPLGSMGTPVEVVHEGVTVKLCCKSCIDDCKATPDVFIAELKQGN